MNSSQDSKTNMIAARLIKLYHNNKPYDNKGCYGDLRQREAYYSTSYDYSGYVRWEKDGMVEEMVNKSLCCELSQQAVSISGTKPRVIYR